MRHASQPLFRRNEGAPQASPGLSQRTLANSTPAARRILPILQSMSAGSRLPVFETHTEYTENTHCIAVTFGPHPPLHR